MNLLRNKKIGLIGVGNMGASILKGVLKRKIATPSSVWVYDKIKSKAGHFARSYRVRWAASARELLQKTDVVIVAVKPQDFPVFAAENSSYVHPGHQVISILAGMTTEKIGKMLRRNKNVVRAMPNLGAKAGQSMTAICGKSKKALSLASALFSGCGEVVILPEKRMDLVTAVSGSGPAYFFHLMELLADFGVRQGLSPKTAQTLAVQTALGAALVAKHSKASCGELRQMVTSKKGTTDAALKALRRGKFKKTFCRALAAAVARSRELRRNA